MGHGRHKGVCLEREPHGNSACAPAGCGRLKRACFACWRAAAWTACSQGAEPSCGALLLAGGFVLNRNDIPRKATPAVCAACCAHRTGRQLLLSALCREGEDLFVGRGMRIPASGNCGPRFIS